MHVSTYRVGDKVILGENVVLTVIDVQEDQVRFGINAPRGTQIRRDEVGMPTFDEFDANNLCLRFTGWRA